MANKKTQSKHILQNKNNLIERFIECEFICEDGLNRYNLSINDKSIDLEKLFEYIFEDNLLDSNEDDVNFIGNVVFTLYDIFNYEVEDLYDTIYMPFKFNGLENVNEFNKRETLLYKGSFLKTGYTQSQFIKTLLWWNKNLKNKNIYYSLWDLIYQMVGDNTSFEITNYIKNNDICPYYDPEDGVTISRHMDEIDNLLDLIKNAVESYKEEFLETHTEIPNHELDNLKKAFLMIDFEKVCELMYPAKHFKSSKVNKSGLDYENTQNELKKLRDEVKKVKAELKKLRSTPQPSGKL